MIRIDLRRRQRRGASWLLVGFLMASVLILAVAGLYWVDQQFPLCGVWRRLWQASPSETATPTEPRIGVSARSGPPAEDEPPSPSGTAELLAEGAPPERVEQPASAATRDTVDLHQAVLEADVEPCWPRSDSVQAAEPRLGVRSAACQLALLASARMPGETRLTALTCRASGEYSLEGLSTSPQPVEALLESLEQLPSDVNLKWGQSASRQVDYLDNLQFSFQGEFGDLVADSLKTLAPKQAMSLQNKVTEWADQAHLEDVAVGNPIRLGGSSSLIYRRQKVWATGSYGQVRSFLQQFRQVQDVVTLGEVVIVPVSGGNGTPGRARLYCALDWIVRDP